MTQKKQVNPQNPPNTKTVTLFNMNTLVASDVISGSMEGLAKAGVIIWQAGKDQDAKVVDRVKEELERTRWSDFSNIAK